MDNGNQKLFADAVRLVLVQADVTSANYRYVHTDHLGTPLAVTDKDKRVVWRASYDPFGAASVNDDPDGDAQRVTLNLRFAGQYFDAESGTHYNYFRNYDPTTGRYLQSDPIGLTGGLNTFSYVDGNPSANTDPTGLVKGLDKLYGLGKKFWKWAHRDEMDISDLSADEARALKKEWERLGRPGPDNKNVRDRRFDEGGFVDPALLLEVMGPLGLLLSPSELACSELDCDKNGIPDFIEREEAGRDQPCP